MYRGTTIGVNRPNIVYLGLRLVCLMQEYILFLGQRSIVETYTDRHYKSTGIPNYQEKRGFLDSRLHYRLWLVYQYEAE